MAILSRLFETRITPSRNGLAALIGRGMLTSSSINVSIEGALTYAAVYACVRVIAESVASLPLLTYRRLPNGGKERAEHHGLFNLLKEQPNPEMTSFEFRELCIAHVCLWGNAYAEIEYSNAGQPVALWPLRPDRMQVQRGEDGDLWYYYARSWGETERQIDWVRLPAWRIHHTRGMSPDGIVGYSPVRMHMEAIGLGLGTQEFGSKFFGNGARPGTILRHPGALSDKAYDRLRSSWENRHQGLENAHRVAILEEGMDVSTIGVPPEEAQFLETRKFQLNDICRIYRVPPHMVADLDKATFSNIEHQSLDFVVHTLRPWLVRSEQAIRRDLIAPDERRAIFVEYLVDGLLRGDIKSRYEAYAVGRQNGWLSANDVRLTENMNPIAGGNEYLVPLNMIPAGEAGRQDPPTRGAQQRSDRQPAQLSYEQRADEEPDDVRTVRVGRQKLARAMLPMFEDVAGRVIRREVNDVRRAVEKYLRRRATVQEFRDWLTGFYAEFSGVWTDNFLPLLISYAEQVSGLTAAELDIDDPGVTDELRAFVDEYLANFGNAEAASSRRQMEALLEQAASDEEAADLIEERLRGWEDTQPAKTGLRQAFEAVNALAIATYVVAGVTTLRWAASGESCPFCRKLNGKVIGINEYFIKAGDEVDGGEAGTMAVTGNVRSGNLHQGCDCVVVAG
jgi:HK97 family phage portal protein